ncbi:unnamed protein product, partial [marine sediment metagenome]
FDRFTSLELTNDMSSASEAAFELGDDGTWDALYAHVAHGAQYRVTLNNRPRMTGRIEVNDVPMDASSGAVVRFVVRTKLSDAQFATADPTVKVRKVSVEDFLLALYAKLGYTKDDFLFAASTGRNLLTGKDGPAGTDVDLEAIKVDEARVHLPETIFQAADRHLRRHGLMHWDSPDGKIIVGAPDDEQEPIYH